MGSPDQAVYRTVAGGLALGNRSETRRFSRSLGSRPVALLRSARLRSSGSIKKNSGLRSSSAASMTVIKKNSGLRSSSAASMTVIEAMNEAAPRKDEPGTALLWGSHPASERFGEWFGSRAWAPGAWVLCVWPPRGASTRGVGPPVSGISGLRTGFAWREALGFVSRCSVSLPHGCLMRS